MQTAYTSQQDSAAVPLMSDDASECLKAFIDSSFDGYWDWNIPENHEYMSPRFWEILGYAPEEKRHHPDEWQQLIFPEDLKIALTQVEQHIATRGQYPFSQEARYRHKDGSTVYVMCRGRVVSWDEEGNPLRMIGTHTDITVQKREQLRAIELAERYRLCVQGSNAGIWDWNIYTGELFWSERFQQMLGIKAGDFIPHFDSFVSRLHPDDRGRVARALETHCDHDVAFNLEFRLRKEGEDYMYVHMRGKSVSDPVTGKTVRMAGSVDDVTDIRLLKEKEREAALLLQHITDNNPDAIFVKDEQFRIIQANPVFLNFYPENKRDTVIGTTTLEEYDAAEAENFLANDRKAFAQGCTETMETVHFPNGEKRILSTKKIRFENHRGEAHILGLARDVTETQELLRNLNRSNEELDDFAYIASHDLKEPLRGMHNHAQFILEDHSDTLDDDVQRRVQRIVALSVHAEQLVQDLLYYAGISRAEESHQPADIKALLCDLTDAIAPEMADTSVRLHGDFPVLNCKHVRVKEVFRNLMTNGVKYNRSEHKIIDIGTDKAQSLPGRPVFYVKDNGIGIDARHHEDVFRIFKQLNKRDTYGSGSGAGLTITKKIINNHGGDIWLTSARGVGTTFYFTLGNAS